MIKTSDYVAEELQRRGVTAVYELIGGMITHLIDSIHMRTKIKLVSMHHEQGAAFAADATGRLSGIPGVAMATSGPGAVNLLTGVGSCYFDSSPAVFITGQVNRHEMRGERAIRQLGFQETDIVSMAKPITKAAWLARSSEEVPELLDRAFALATEGRPGPVLLDLPMDVQRGMIEPGLSAPTTAQRAADGAAVPNMDVCLDNLFTDLAKAQRPLIIAGGGVYAGRSAEMFQAFVEKLGVPVLHSLMAVDVLPYEHPLRVGMLGSYGNRWANLALGLADFVLVLGSRLDVRQTGADTESFKAQKTIYHIDVQPGEINNRVTGCKSVVAEIRDFLAAATRQVPAHLPRWPEWRKQIAGLREAWPDVAELKDVAGINPNVLMHRLSRASHGAAAFVVDVGQHQMWAAQSLELQPGQRFLTSGGMGSMGFSLPAAIGAACVTGKPIVVVAGDGGFQCNIQELQTVARNQLPIHMVVVDNGCHGMVRQFQESYFDQRYQSTLWGYSAPDFARVAESYGISARTVEDPAGLDAALAWLAGHTNRPALLHVKIHSLANAYPKLAFGRPITEMEPFAKPLEMEGT